MKILLTGASGFVGSHILDSLRARGIPIVVLLRPESSRRFLEHHLPEVEIRTGTISDAGSLERAMPNVTHVIHCAGCTKALRVAEFCAVNQVGTRNVVEAVNRRQGRVQRLILISSLAAAGPALPAAPARESDVPRPVSEYGRSKLAAENEVRERCQADFVILRPPAVYGPRDAEFLRLFKAVKAHVLPSFGGGKQPLSLVFVRNLAEAVAECLTHPVAVGKTYFVAAPGIVTAGGMAGEIAAQMGAWTLPLPLPAAALWPVCALAHAASRLTGRASVLSLQKHAELRARGWVCDASRLREDLGFTCATTLKAGIAETLAWYRKERWL